MKASRITAIGLVAAAALWIASGHFLPHESAESRAAIRAGESEAKKLFRVAVVDDRPSCRTAASSSCPAAPRPTSAVIVTARTGGVLTELKVQRGTWVKKGDIIAVLSDEAREAQVAQAQALVTQTRDRARGQARADRERHDAAARARQSRGAAQGGRSRARRRRGRARPRHRARAVVRRRHRRRGRGRPGRVLVRRPRDRARSSRSIRCWRWSRWPSASSPASRSATPPRCGSSPARRASGRIRFVSKTASPTTRTYRVEVEVAQRRRRDSGRHHRRGRRCRWRRCRRRGCRARR